MVFTGHNFNDGGFSISKTLKQQKIKASFFLTGDFYRKNPKLIRKLIQNGNYLGSHSNKHLLYCDWNDRNHLLVTRDQFIQDLDSAYQSMQLFGISKKQAVFYLPAYEWYNDSIAAWTKEIGLQLVNFTPGTYSNADYTYPEMGKNYLSTDTIFQRILQYEQEDSHGLNGFILLLHIGTDPRRTDKFYNRLPQLIAILKDKGYHFVCIDQLLK